MIRFANSTACRFDSAIVRTPPRSAVNGLRAVDVGAPDIEALRRDHKLYVSALENAGLAVTILPALEAFPDSLFVEDPALVFSEGAIVLRPGAPSRMGEAAMIEPALRLHFVEVLNLPEGAYADGGDILTLADVVMIGLSARTNRQGAEAVIAALARFGRKGMIVETPRGVLHFKTDCSPLGDNAVLATRRLAASGCFAGRDVLLVPEGEEAAANALRLNDQMLIGQGFPKTAALLKEAGFSVWEMPLAEMGKLDAGLSCMSLRWAA